MSDNPIVIAPTLQMAKQICDLFGLNYRKHARAANKNSLHGYGRETTFLMYVGYPWEPRKEEEIRRAIEAGGSLIIDVPELQRVSRPLNVTERRES